jgi:hypothetical protein
MVDMVGVSNACSTSTIFTDLGPLIKTQVEHHQQVGADEGARH